MCGGSVFWQTETVEEQRKATEKRCLLEQIKVVQLVVVPRDGSLDLARVDPGDKVLHVSCHHESRIANCIRAHTHMPLLDVLDRLSHRLRHLQPHHHHRQPASAERGDIELVGDVRHLGSRVE